MLCTVPYEGKGFIGCSPGPATARGPKTGATFNILDINETLYNPLTEKKAKETLKNHDFVLKYT